MDIVTFPDKPKACTPVLDTMTAGEITILSSPVDNIYTSPGNNPPEIADVLLEKICIPLAPKGFKFKPSAVILAGLSDC